MSGRQRYELWVGVLIAVALALLAWMSVMVGAVGGLGPQVHIQLRSRDAAGIAAGASVMVYGVEVGRVEQMRLEPGAAVAEIAIGAIHQIPFEVIPRVRARSVLGEKYIELSPKERSPIAAAAEAAMTEGVVLLKDGDVLSIDHMQVEIDEMVDQIGALDIQALISALQVVLDELRDNPQRIEDAFRRLDSILVHIDEASAKLPALMDHADGTLSRLDQTLDEANARLRQTEAPIKKLEGLIDDARPIPPLIPPVIEEGKAALVDARRVLGKAEEFIDKLDGVDRDLKAVLSNFAEIDKYELRRLLREEGILIRVRPNEVEVPFSPSE